MMDDDANDDDEGRTVVRGAPKIVKRSTKNLGGMQQPPTTISPAAVIKATLESARANRRDQLMPGPPSDLLEDSADFNESPKTPFICLSPTPHMFEPAGAGYDRAPFEGRPVAPPSSHAGTFAKQSVPPAAPSSYAGGFGHVPSAAASVPGVAPASMPAHFMTPQAPYGASNDPPATAVTSGHKVSGRPALSWAAALLACGLFVGVAAVAVMQSSDSVADTTASFVDPSRGAKKAATPAQVAAPVGVAAANAPAATAPAADPNAPPPGLLGASTAAAPPPVAAPVADPNLAVAPVVATPPAATAPAVAQPGHPAVAFAPVAVPSASAKPTAAPAATTPPAPRPTFAWKPAPPPPAAAPAPKPTPPAKAPPAVAAASEEEAPKKTAKAGKSAGKGAGETDDETKKALEALQKAQLESASSFGDK